MTTAGCAPCVREFWFFEFLLLPLLRVAVYEWLSITKAFENSDSSYEEKINTDLPVNRKWSSLFCVHGHRVCDRHLELSHSASFWLFCCLIKWFIKQEGEGDTNSSRHTHTHTQNVAWSIGIHSSTDNRVHADTDTHTSTSHLHFFFLYQCFIPAFRITMSKLLLIFLFLHSMNMLHLFAKSYSLICEI